MKTISKKKAEFNDFRFKGLKWEQHSNNYITSKRVSEDESKIVVKVENNHLVETKFGYALILDKQTVVFLKKWQVDINFFGTEIIIDRNFFKPTKWGEHNNFENNEENHNFKKWLEVAKKQKETKVLFSF